MAGLILPGHSWALSSTNAPSDDIRRAQLHLERGCDGLLSDRADYVGVIQRGHTHPASTSTGLLPNAAMGPEMNHTDGLRIQSTGLVFFFPDRTALQLVRNTPICQNTFWSIRSLHCSQYCRKKVCGELAPLSRLLRVFPQGAHLSILLYGPQ